jgi:hypothetical protein
LLCSFVTLPKWAIIYCAGVFGVSKAPTIRYSLA